MAEGPYPLEDFLASLAEGLKVRGDARSLAVLLAGNCSFDYLDTDFGVRNWGLQVGLPVALFHALSSADIEQVQAALCEVGQSFFRGPGDDWLQRVTVTPSVVPAPAGWRDDALRFVRGEGVTNQGRVRSDNIASQQHRGLLFRSRAEISLFEAMQRAQLAVAPLPVFVRVGKNYHRLEPDFVVVYKGLTFVVEVDGDTFHRETPAEADKRLIPLTYEGVEVRRVRAADVASDQLADTAVRELIEFMAKRKAAR